MTNIQIKAVAAGTATLAVLILFSSIIALSARYGAEPARSNTPSAVEITDLGRIVVTPSANQLEQVRLERQMMVLDGKEAPGIAASNHPAADALPL